MSHGIRITNPSGELVISSDALGLYCIGKAVQQSLVQSSGSPTGPLPGKVSGRSVYRISHSGQILVALDLPASTYVAALGIDEVSSGVWDITISAGTTLDSEAMVTTQISLDVWAFGLPPSNTLYDSYGLAIYDSAGDLAWDLSRPNPLFGLAYIDGVGPGYTIPSLTRPVILCVPYNREYNDSRLVNTHTVTERRGALLRTGTTLTKAQVNILQYQYFSPDDVGPEIDDVAMTSFILEGALLP